MNKKFELIKNDSIEMDNHKLYRIRALIDFNDVKAGDLGGYVEHESNLSQTDDCWIYDNAYVFGNASVYDNAYVFGNASVYDNAKVSGNAHVFGNAKVSGNAYISDNARVFGDTRVFSKAKIYGNAHVFENARVFNDACVYDITYVYGNACVCDNARVYNSANVYGNTSVCDNANVCGNAEICGNALINSNDDYIVFKNTWSSGRYFTYTKSNKMWKVGCFYGTSDELIQKAYADSVNSGKNYELCVNLVKENE